MATRDRELVRGGVLDGYVLGSYSARKLGLRTTGNAGGTHNLQVESRTEALPLAQLLQRMQRGLLVTEMMGQGVNGVTCLLYTSPSPRDRTRSRMPSSA